MFYSLLPVLSAVLLLIVFLGYIPLQNVVHGTADNLQLAWDTFGQEWQSLQNELLSLQSQLDLDAFRSSVNYQAAVKSRIYQFINQGVSRPQFFLLDADENLVFSSQTNEAMRESLQNSFHWRLVNNLPAPAGKAATVVARAEVGVSTVSSMLVGCCLYDEKGGVGGYLYFALDEDRMAAQFKQCASDLIVTDRFDSVFLGTNSAFVGDFGKLRVMLRDANGSIMLPEGLFYIRTLTTQNGFLRIHAMSECGGIISTLLLLGALVLVFFGVFTAVILVSTERVSRQKTRIIDEIAAACYQVQQGDLNTERDFPARVRLPAQAPGRGEAGLFNEPHSFRGGNRQTDTPPDAAAQQHMQVRLAGHGRNPRAGRLCGCGPGTHCHAQRAAPAH